MSIDKVIEIKCGGEATKNLDDLHHFQGDLKTIDKDAFDNLKASIVKDGLPFGFYVWDNKGKLEIVDGHHRRLALLSLREDGYFIPPLPVNFVKAKNRKEAAKSVLISNSRYAKMTEEGHADFMINFDLKMDDIEFMDFPDIEFGSKEDNKESEESSSETPKTQNECPKCGYEW